MPLTSNNSKPRGYIILTVRCGVRMNVCSGRAVVPTLLVLDNFSAELS